MSPLDWGSIASAVIGSSVAMAIIGYLLKTAIDRSLDIRLDRMREKSKAEIQEDFRRQALVWNSQYEAGKALVALIYRFRNTFHELSPILNDPSHEREQRTLFRRLEIFGSGINELLYEERGVLQPALFRAAHELKSPLMELRLISREYLKPSSGAPPLRAPSRINNIYERIDAIYSIVVDLFHKDAGIATQGD
jgi:hypothetical protein